jgi:hypothetical protein
MITAVASDAHSLRPFAPRPIVPHAVLVHGDWRLKRYAITVGDTPDEAPLDWNAFAPGVALALDALPAPATAPGRPGVGFLIAHRGRGADYVVIGWWSAENELPVRVLVRPQHAGGAWRGAREGESFCVWDLQVLAFERDAWVATALAPDGDAPLAARLEAYLARRLHAHP